MKNQFRSKLLAGLWVPAGLLFSQQALAASQVPARIEAEDFDNYYELTSQHYGNCGSGPVDQQVVSSDPMGGACYIGWTQGGEWLEYDITAETGGTWDVALRLASNSGGKNVRVSIDGMEVGSATAPANGWGVYSSISVGEFQMDSGSHKLRVDFDQGGVDLNFFEVSQLSSDGGSGGDNGGSLTDISDLTVTNTGCEEITLNWSDVGGETEYRVRRKVEGQSSFTNLTDVPANTSSYVDTSVTEGVTYIYMVRPVVDNTAVKVSNQPSITVSQCDGGNSGGEPVDISDLSATATACDSVALSWSDVDGEDKYRVRRAPQGSSSYTILADLPANSTSYVDASANESTSYQYMVRPMVNDTAVNISNTPNVTTPQCGGTDPGGDPGGNGDLVNGLKLYPAPSGRAASDQYKVEIQDSKGNWKEAYVYLNDARSDGNGSDRQKDRSFSYVTFELNQALKVRVKRKEGATGSVKIRPSRLGISTTTVNSSTVEFTLKPKQKVSVEFGNEMKKCYFYDDAQCMKDILVLFADEPADNELSSYSNSEIYYVSAGNHKSGYKSTLGNANGKSVVVFQPGVYDIGYWAVPTNIDHIHVEGGALVYGAIDVQPYGNPDPNDYQNGWRQFNLKESFKLTGHGVISGSNIRWHLNKFGVYEQNDMWWRLIKGVQFAVENLTLKDVTIEDSPYWVMSFANDDDNRTKGTMTNFKLVGAWTYNNDGTPIPEGANSSISDCFIHANDDAFKLYNSDSSINNCVVWQSENGAVFQTGWFPKTIDNVTTSNIDVIWLENWYHPGNNLGLLNFANAGGGGTISNLNFNNIYVEGNVMRIIGLSPSNGQKFDGITFKNLIVDQMNYDSQGTGRFNYLTPSGSSSIKNVTFDNFKVAGNKVDNANEAKLETSGSVSNITFK